MGIKAFGEAAEVSFAAATYQKINHWVNEVNTEDTATTTAAKTTPSCKVVACGKKAIAEIGYLFCATAALVEAFARFLALVILAPAAITKTGREFYMTLAESVGYNFLMVAHAGATAFFYNFRHWEIDTDQISRDIFPYFQKMDAIPLPRITEEVVSNGDNLVDFFPDARNLDDIDDFLFTFGKGHLSARQISKITDDQLI